MNLEFWVRLVLDNENYVGWHAACVLITLLRERYLRAALPTGSYVQRQNLVLHTSRLSIRIQHFPASCTITMSTTGLNHSDRSMCLR